ncbi:MAG: DUF2442 domain-containing protein [Alphaproteobacteria bacterium]|nr:DUF2442 domain-containing protein [Alphaproteobacteria bacterium]
MIKTPYPPIVAVKPGPGCTLTVTWKDGTVHGIDLGGWLAEHPPLGPLLADDALFATVQVGEWGGDLHWTDDLEIPDDVLWSLGLEQDAARFREWRKSRGLTQEQAAAELGISTRMVTYYEAGSHPIPKTVTLARFGFDALRQMAA